MTALAVILMTTAAESLLMTLSPVVEAFMRVLVGFDGGRAGIWRLPAMVGVVEVEVSNLG